MEAKHGLFKSRDTYTPKSNVQLYKASRLLGVGPLISCPNLAPALSTIGLEAILGCGARTNI